MRGVIGHCRQGEDQGAKTDRQSGACRPSEILMPLWQLTYSYPYTRGNAIEGVLHVIDQKVSCLERTLEVVARETENFADLANGVFRVIRYVLQTREGEKVEIAMREPVI